MKFTRKMVLVDFDKYMKLNEKPEKELDTSAKPLYGLNSEMSEILNDNKLSDYEKHSKYLKKLNKFLFLNQRNQNNNNNNTHMNSIEIIKQEPGLLKNVKKEKVKVKKETLNYESDESDASFLSTKSEVFDDTITNFEDPNPKFQNVKHSPVRPQKKFFTPPNRILRSDSTPVKNKEFEKWKSYENILKQLKRKK